MTDETRLPRLHDRRMREESSRLGNPLWSDQICLLQVSGRDDLADGMASTKGTGGMRLIDRLGFLMMIGFIRLLLGKPMAVEFAEWLERNER